jgi:hypothetical protein
MKVQSTGLGKSVMLAHIKGLGITEFEDERVLQMTMESTEPLHWYIQVYMEPADVRQAILKGLKPKLVWKTLLAILFNRFSLFSGKKGEVEVSAAEPEAADKPEAKAAPPSTPPDEEEPVSPLARLKG